MFKARTTLRRGLNPPVRRPLIENVPVNVLVEIDADHRKETKLIQELSATISLFKGDFVLVIGAAHRN